MWETKAMGGNYEKDIAQVWNRTTVNLVDPGRIDQPVIDQLYRHQCGNGHPGTGSGGFTAI
jgi:hypothetical protein